MRTKESILNSIISTGFGISTKDYNFIENELKSETLLKIHTLITCDLQNQIEKQ